MIDVQRFVQGNRYIYFLAVKEQMKQPIMFTFKADIVIYMNLN